MGLVGIAFDFDGVIVDSVEGHYIGYCNILSRFGLTGTRDEFALLNGPPMHEVFRILRNRHSELPDSEKLALAFQVEQQSVYKNAPLFRGVRKVLMALKQSKIPCVVASSAREDLIRSSLRYHEISIFFRDIIGADTVKRGKPNPDVYQAAATRLNTTSCIAIDDTEQGVTAALRAGVSAVRFSADGMDATIPPVLTIDNLEELLPMVDRNVCWMSQYTQYTRSQDQSSGLDDITRIEAYWKKHARNSMFNAPKTLVTGIEGNVLSTRQADYKEVFYRLSNPKSNAMPVGVTGIVVDADNNVIIGRRAESTSQYMGLWETAPAGSIDQWDEHNTIENQLLTELNEELGISKDSVAKLGMLGLIKDLAHNQLDFVYVICTRQPLKTLTMQIAEYSEHRILPLTSAVRLAASKEAVPLMLPLLEGALNFIRTRKDFLCVN